MSISYYKMKLWTDFDRVSVRTVVIFSYRVLVYNGYKGM